MADKGIEIKNDKETKEGVYGCENSSFKECENSYRAETGLIKDMCSRINFKELEKKMKKVREERRALSLLRDIGRKTKTFPPSYQRLWNADLTMCMEKTLFEVIFNYKMLSYNTIFGRALCDPRDLEISCCELVEDIYELFISKDNFHKYENAVNKLICNNVKAAKNMLLDLVNEAVEPAIYAYTLVFFKEIIEQCDVLNLTKENEDIMEMNKDDLIASVELLKRASLMEPASSFLLGMMKIYDIGKCSQFMKGSWKDDLIYVVNVARDCGFFHIKHYMLESIDYESSWHTEKCSLGMVYKKEYIKEMGKYSLYELLLNSLSEQYLHINAISNLFQILDDLPEALYTNAVLLFQSKIGNKSKKDINKAIWCLERACSFGHQGARFLLGILPFKNVNHLLTPKEMGLFIKILESYIRCSDGSCAMNKENVDEMACCLAAEYYREDGYLVPCNKQKAEEILKSRALHTEWNNLQS